MRKLMLFVCSICICILSSFSFVHAEELVFADYVINSYYTNNSGNWSSFNTGSNLPDAKQRFFHFIIQCPDVEAQGAYFDIDINCWFSGYVLSDSITIYGRDTNGTIATNKVVMNYEDNGEGPMHLWSYHELENSLPVKDYVISFLGTPTSRSPDFFIYDLNFVKVEYNSKKQLDNIFDAILNLPSSIASSFDKFFHSDDPIVNESESLNNELSNSINNYNDVESGLFDNFNSSITNLDTNVNLFNMTDFISTSNFLSTQLTNIFSINQNIQNMIMYSLIMGFAFVLIGIGVKR